MTEQLSKTLRTRTVRAFATVAAHPVFAYSSIMAIQLRVIWDFWSGLDLTTGDTSGYFTVAQVWAASFKNVFFWSPLYTAYYGTVLKVIGNPVTATLIHRLIVVFAVTALVLALTRRLLPAGAAWLVTAWWAVLPINFDTLYEVHLFALVPTLVAILLVAKEPSHGRRASALAIFASSTVLVRNEMVFATLIFGAMCLWALLAEARRSGGLRSFVRLLSPYLVGAAAVALIVTFFYSRSTVQFPALADTLRERRTVNFCQAYAFNHRQRNPEWSGNPFLDCGELMASTFGTEGDTELAGPSFTEALRLNPDAVLAYVRWNAVLAPNGIQLALFNGTSGSESPDYVPVAVNQLLPWILSIICLLVLLGGAWAFLEDRHFWVDWVTARRWPLLAMAAPAFGAVIVMLQQRPRPSYMFAFTLFLMVLIGFCLHALLRSWGAGNLLAASVVPMAVVLIISAPSPYTGRSKPLQEIYDRLRPYASELSRTPTAVPGYGTELCRYLAVGDCKIVDYWATLRPPAEAGGSLETVLDQSDIALFYADTAVLNDPIMAPVVGRTNSKWTMVDGEAGRWALFRRVPDTNP